jgi:hypothetical protein
MRTFSIDIEVYIYIEEVGHQKNYYPILEVF